jgi:hypothetical protein
VKLKFYGEEFPFELISRSATSIKCLLKHSEETRQRYGELCDAEEVREEEEGPWYLDSHGERLESEELFQASPWALETPEGEIKLLSRIEEGNGEILFNMPEGYGGELFKWLRA